MRMPRSRCCLALGEERSMIPVNSHGHGHHGLGSDPHPHHHAHTHGLVDPSIAATARGMWALKWSFAGLMVTASLQVVVVWLSGSVALLADTIHNVGDAATAIPLDRKSTRLNS